MLVNDIEGSVRLSKNRMFRSLFSRKGAPLAHAPAVPRLIRGIAIAAIMPELMKDQVRVRNAGVEAISEALDL